MELQKAISATQPEGALKAEALSQIKCNPSEVDYRRIRRKRTRAHSRVCIRNFTALVNHTNSVRIRLLKPRLECFHSIDSCSTQPHETWVISHDYTEAHSPIKPGLGSLSFNSSPNPKHTTIFRNSARKEFATGADPSGYTTLSPNYHP